MKGPRESQASWDYWSYEKTAVDTPHHPDTKRFSHFSKSSFSLSSSLSISLSIFRYKSYSLAAHNIIYRVLGLSPKTILFSLFQKFVCLCFVWQHNIKILGVQNPTVLQFLKQPYLDLFRRVGRHFCLSKTAGLYISLSLVLYMICM